MSGFRTPVSTRPNRDSPNPNSIDILEGQMHGLVSWTTWWQDAIQSFRQLGSTGIAILMGDFPSYEPRHASTWQQHIITFPTRNQYQYCCVRFVASFLPVGADFLNNFLMSLLAVGGSVDSISLTPTIHCLTSRVWTRRACSQVHPLLETATSNSPTLTATVRTAQAAWGVPVIKCLMKFMSGGTSDGHIILAGLEFPQAEIHDVTMLGFQFVQDPGIPFRDFVQVGYASSHPEHFR